MAFIFYVPPANAVNSNSEIYATASGGSTSVGGLGAASVEYQQGLVAQQNFASNPDASAPVEPDPNKYAYTEPCTGQSTDCNLTKCTDSNGNTGVTLSLLRADANAAVEGVGAHIDWDNQNRLAGWQRAGTFCSAILDAPEGDAPAQQLIITVTNEDFRSLNVLPASIMGQGSGHTLKNFNTNLWADAQEQTFDTQISGRSVRVVATPVSYIFDYGDGTTITSFSPGYGLPAGQEWADIPTDTSHVYTETGDYNATVTTVYSGRYSVEGGPWLPVAGTNEVVSDPRVVRVWKVKVGNVAEDCLANSTAWGC
ncbi:hypothetical protein [Rothia sp. ZJ1223]|uniref:hypothetical protein n=1 Tax=Rothia sp. ZJ1223 TaxID=2811098 RepID=UPI00195DDF54|nr:hypothetical protein [Rothia sp. ZJ1223]MBM7051732.1 hypothetical protein [Rothia sp. ZJ1223]